MDSKWLGTLAALPVLLFVVGGLLDFHTFSKQLSDYIFPRHHTTIIRKFKGHHALGKLLLESYFAIVIVIILALVWSHSIVDQSLF